MTSPPMIVESARKIGRLAVSLMYWTCPSSIRTLTPPGWKLLGPVTAAFRPLSVQSGCLLFYV
jgi:hypothetical protein